MAKRNHRPGGGIASRQHKTVGYRQGAPNRAVSKKWVSQIGSSQGNRAQLSEEGGGGKVMTGVRASPFKGSGLNPAPLGNQVAASTQCGAGGSRAIHRSGSQHSLADRQNNPKGRPFDQRG